MVVGKETPQARQAAVCIGRRYRRNDIGSVFSESFGFADARRIACIVGVILFLLVEVSGMKVIVWHSPRFLRRVLRGLFGIKRTELD
jgi:hypothetical protein